MTFRTKPGAHGTLYLYEVKYNDAPNGEPAEHEDFSWRTWAYDAGDALDRFYGAADADGWVHTSEPRRVKEKAA